MSVTRRGAYGFTLIEMLVVVAIIMILGAMVYPVYEVVTKRSEAAHCSSNIRNLAVAAGLYAEDNDGVLPPARNSCGAPAVYGTSWDVIMMPYFRSQQMCLCLSDQTPTWASNTTCYKHSYGINLDLTMVGGYNGSALCTSDLQSPAQTILFFEIAGSAHALGSSYGANKLSRIDERHNGGSNYAFVDGHARWLRARTTATGSTNMWLP